MKFYFFPEMSLHFLMFITTVFSEVCFLFLSIENLIFNVSTANIKEPSGPVFTGTFKNRATGVTFLRGTGAIINLKHYSSDCQVTWLRVLGAKEVPDVNYNLLGQYCVLQVRVLSLSPLQSSPPLEGGGLLQILVILCVPPPHVSVHSVHRLQLPQFPFTVSSKSSYSSDNNSLVWFYWVISLASCKPDV